MLQTCIKQNHANFQILQLKVDNFNFY